MNFLFSSTTSAPAMPRERSASQVSALSALVSRPWLCVALLTVLGAVLRAFHLGQKSLWIDEAIIFWITQGEPSYVVKQNAFWNSAPPTYPLLLSVLARDTGSEATLRALSMLGGVLSIPALYLLAQMLLPRAFALFVVLMAALSFNLVRYSQELREYSWTFGVSCLVLAAFIKADREASRRSVWLLVAALWCGFALQYGFFVVLLGLNFVWLARAVKKQTRLGWGAWANVQVASVFAAAVAFFVSAQRQLQPDAYGTASARGYLHTSHWNGDLVSLLPFTVLKTVFTFRFASPGLKFLLPVVGVLALLAVLKGGPRVSRWLDERFATQTRDEAEQERSAATLTFLLWLGATGATWLLALLGRYPFNGGRQNMFLMPMVFVLSGWALLWLSRSRWRRVLVPVAVLLGMGGLLDTAKYLRGRGDEPVRDLTRALHAQRQPGDRIWISRSSQPIYTFYRRDLDPRTFVATKSRVPGGSEPPRQVGDAQARLSLHDGYGRALPARPLPELLRAPGRVWVMFSQWDTDKYRADTLRSARLVRPNAQLVLRRERKGFLYLMP